MHRHTVTILKFGISIAILGYLFVQANQDQQFQQLFDTKKNWWWVLVALLSCLAAHLISYVRWHVMAKAVGFSLTIWEAIKIGLIGTFFNVLAFGVVGGDSLRAFYAARRTKSKVPEAIASVFADRVIGLLAMCGIAIIAFNFKDFSDEEPNHWRKLAAIQYTMRVATIMFAVGMLGFVGVFFSPQIREWQLFKRIGQWRWIGPVFNRVMDVVALYRKSPGAIVKAFAMSAVTNTLFALTIFAIACGIVDSHPTFPNHFIIAPISMVANAVPLPGGLGGMEFALDFLYQGFSHEAVPSENGFIVAIGFRFSLLLVSLIGLGVWFAYRSDSSIAVEQTAAKSVA